LKLVFNDMVIYVWEGVYPPSDDTFLLLDYLNLNGRERVLDIGTGTGILAIRCALKGCYAVGLDVNRRAVRNAKFNAKINNVDHLTCFLCCDATTSLRGKCDFDVIVMNPPYLPSTGDPRIDEPSWDGGPDGSSLIVKVINGLNRLLGEDGKLYLVISSLSDFTKIMSRLKVTNFNSAIVAKKRLWFEELFLVEVKKCSSSG
jgi:release factor glutamine methyltransferase